MQTIHNITGNQEVSDDYRVHGFTRGEIENLFTAMMDAAKRGEIKTKADSRAWFAGNGVDDFSDFKDAAKQFGVGQ